MAVHKISVKQLVSRVHQVFPGAPENYILNLINDANTFAPVTKSFRHRGRETGFSLPSDRQHPLIGSM